MKVNLDAKFVNIPYQNHQAPNNPSPIVTNIAQPLLAKNVNVVITMAPRTVSVMHSCPRPECNRGPVLLTCGAVFMLGLIASIIYLGVTVGFRGVYSEG